MRFGVYGLAVSAIVMQVAAAQAETFADALASAYKTSNLLEQNQAVLRATSEDVAVAIAALRPVVQFVATAANSWNNTYPSASTGWAMSLSADLALTAQYTLYDFGRGETNVEVTKETVLATEQSLRSVEQQVLLSAAQAYINVTLQQEMVAMQQSNVRLITQDLRATQDRFDVGEVTRTDVSQAEAQLAAAKAQLAASEGQLALAREAYKAAVGHYPQNLAALPRAPELPGSLAEAQAIAVKTHPTVIQAQHQAKAADLRLELTRLNFQPTITATAKANVTHVYTDAGTNLPSVFDSSSTKDGLVGSVTMSQTIYAGGQLSALYRKGLDAQDAARAGLELAAVTVSQGVGNAWANLAVAAASIQAGDQQIAAAQSALDGVREEAAVGSRTTLDVLNAEQALLNAKAARVQSVANLYLGKYALLSAMGLMTADHLKLGVPTYDPNAYYEAIKTAPLTSTQGAKLDKIMKLMGRD